MSREPYATDAKGNKYYSRKEYEDARRRASNTAAHRKAYVFKKIKALAS
ncbi:hypothetical protein [Prevotella sp. HUN102]|nr:hypothetical protein [Prevotella sp. HUN102]